jgi:hypothetical protein
MSLRDEPAGMSDDQRRNEIAVILAGGLMRRRSRMLPAPQIAGEGRENRLDSGATLRPDGHEVNARRCTR